MKKLFALAMVCTLIAGQVAVAQGGDPKDCKKCPKKSCTKECKDQKDCKRGTAKC